MAIQVLHPWLVITLIKEEVRDRYQLPQLLYSFEELQVSHYHVSKLKKEQNFIKMRRVN